ncbi:MAG: sigma-70 family RNA polymerase sigma factor [Gemmatimonadetes bacterium]|nr:sigma-70 family RNA polymerase sigma factor [Gemmatimonadota bacterium]
MSVEAKKTTKKNNVPLDDSFGMYLRDIGRIPLLKREEEQKLGRRIRGGDEEAVHELVQANLRFVVNISKRYMNRGIPLADLVTEGNLGLYEAARRFDERKGCAFISYAVWWIRRNLNKAMADQLHLVHYPHSRKDTLRDVFRAEEALEKKLERGPSLEEVADSIGKSKKEIQEAMASVRSYSMITDYEDPERETPLNRIADKTEGLAPDVTLQGLECVDDVREAVEMLNQREELIINLYFGLTGEEPYTLGEIGEKLSLSKERIRQLKDRALQRLRSGAMNRRLEAHLN